MDMHVRPPKPVAAFVSAINSHDADALQSAFAEDAVVKDVGREFCGIAAITEWANREIFGANVALEVMKVVDRKSVV